MSLDNIPRHGNPNGKVFGVEGDLTYSDNGFSYVKSGSQSNTLNVDWDVVIPPAPTPSITNTPSITPSRTPIITKTPNVTPTNTPTITPTNTSTSAGIFTPTPTNTITKTPVTTPTVTPSITVSRSKDPVYPPGVSPSPTNTNTQTPSTTPSNTPAISSFSLTITVNGSGTYSVNPNQSLYLSGDFISIDAYPGIKKDFSSATTNAGSINVQSIPYEDGIHGLITFYMNAYNKTVNLNFISQNRELYIVKNGNGSVTPSVGSNIYPIDSNVTLSASPDAGWAFYNWTTSTSGYYPNVNPTITVSQNIVATATFLQLKKVYANVDGIGNYSVTYITPLKSQQTASGNVGEAYFGGQYVLPGVCGIIVVSGGGLLEEAC